MGVSRKIALAIVALGLAVTAVVGPGPLVASDHDDGEVELKGRNLNLTDLYLFRDIDQNPRAFATDLILVMNTNPRSVARQQYYFSTLARYEFRVTRVPDINAAATGAVDVILRFEFGAPDPSTRQQEITVTAIKDGATHVATAALTTPLSMAASPVVNTVHLGGSALRVFAGLREDPFFFDVERYFRVRAGILGTGPVVGFRNPGLDFTAGYNANAVVVRVPRAFLGSTTVFDVWTEIWCCSTTPGGPVRVERLGRPAINEGLITTNDFLNALNSIGPDCEAAALLGVEPCASAAAPIVGEAAAFLTALGNSAARVDALLHAFLADVNRIDTNAPSGYAAAVNTLGSPVRGRKIPDDVIDITLSVLTNGAVTTDNVSYNGPNLGGSRHKPLLRRFPYLAAPN